MKPSFFSVLLIAITIVALLIVSGAFFIVSETDQVIVTQFGKPVGQPVE